MKAETDLQARKHQRLSADPQEHRENDPQKEHPANTFISDF